MTMTTESATYKAGDRVNINYGTPGGLAERIWSGPATVIEDRGNTIKVQVDAIDGREPLVGAFHPSAVERLLPEFEKGDRVRLIDNGNMNALLGTEAIVTGEPYEFGVDVMVPVKWAEDTTQADGGYVATRFEKVELPAFAFKPGDIVMVENPVVCDEDWNGIGVVQAVSEKIGSTQWFQVERVGGPLAGHSGQFMEEYLTAVEAPPFLVGDRVVVVENLLAGGSLYAPGMTGEVVGVSDEVNCLATGMVRLLLDGRDYPAFFYYDELALLPHAFKPGDRVYHTGIRESGTVVKLTPKVSDPSSQADDLLVEWDDDGFGTMGTTSRSLEIEVPKPEVVPDSELIGATIEDEDALSTFGTGTVLIGPTGRPRMKTPCGWIGPMDTTFQPSSVIPATVIFVG